MARTLEYYLSLDYPVEIRRVEEDLGGGFIACIPSLGAQAFVGDGDTAQQAYDNLQAAKAEIFAEYIDEGLPIPEPVQAAEFEDFSGKLMVRMPRELHARLAWTAKENDSSLNQFIVYALSSYEARCRATANMRAIFEAQPPCIRRPDSPGAEGDRYERSGTSPEQPAFLTGEYKQAA